MRTLEDKIKLPSGAERSKFDTSIPGQSWTKEPGPYPWDSPPRFNTSDEVMDYFVDKFDNEKSGIQLIALLKQGISVATIVDSMLLAGFSEGLFTPDVAILTAEDLSMLIMYLGDSAGVDYKKTDENEEKELDDAFRGIAQMETLKKEAEKSDEPLPSMQKMQDTPDVSQGLMAKPTEENI